MQGFVVAFFFFVMMTLSLSVTAEIYTWVDENGKTHFSDQPPADRNINTEVKKEIELHNIDAGYPAGIVVDPDRKRHNKEIAVQKAAVAKRTNKACSKAKTDLRMLSGRVAFRDERGNEVRVSEKDRVKMEKSLREAIRKRCE